jgi:hypothetical protein
MPLRMCLMSLSIRVDPNKMEENHLQRLYRDLQRMLSESLDFRGDAN